MKADSPIAVVGGSLTGPTLALLLKQVGFTNVTVYEAAPDPYAQSGGVIGLDYISLGILESLGINQDEIVPFTSERMVLIKVRNREASGQSITLFPGQNSTWNLVHGALARRVDAYHTGRRVVGFDADESDRAALVFSDGSRESAELVAFADGRRSLGRTQIDDRPLTYAGYVGHRGQAPVDNNSRDFMSYSATASLFNVFPIPMGDRIGLDWTFFLPTSEEEFREQFAADPIKRTFVLPHQITDRARQVTEEAANRLLPPAAAELIARTEERTAVPMVNIDPPTRMVSTLAESPVVMLGDAAAPVRPHTGRGANHGIDQASQLALGLNHHRRHGSDLMSVLTRWQERQIPQIADSLRLGPELARRIGLER